jgi:hypothetical protein
MSRCYIDPQDVKMLYRSPRMSRCYIFIFASLHWHERPLKFEIRLSLPLIKIKGGKWDARKVIDLKMVITFKVI